MSVKVSVELSKPVVQYPHRVGLIVTVVRNAIQAELYHFFSRDPIDVQYPCAISNGICIRIMHIGIKVFSIPEGAHGKEQFICIVVGRGGTGGKSIWYARRLSDDKVC